jgi:hypothetical protein
MVTSLVTNEFEGVWKEKIQALVAVLTSKLGGRSEENYASCKSR